MSFVNLRKKFRCFSFDFRQNSDVRTFPRWLSICGTKFFLRGIQNFFFHNLHFGPIRWVPWRFFKILIRDFLVIFENYSMHMMSIRGNDFIACWAYAEPISSHAEHTRNEFPRMLSQRYNVNIFTCTIHAKHTRNEFYRTLSILERGNFFKSNVSAESNTIFKNLVLQTLGTIRFRFLQKSNKKFLACVPLTPQEKTSAHAQRNLSHTLGLSIKMHWKNGHY